MLVSKIQQNELAIPINITPPFWNFFPLGHHRALGRVPCAMQYILISYLTHSINSVYVSIPVSEFLPLPPFPLIQEKCIYFLYTYKKNVYVFVYVCVSISPLQIK